MKRKTTQIKKVLQKSKYPDFFCNKYKFSPYKGCGHFCLYCDGRYEKYNFNPDNAIEIKQNCPELLDNELPKIREKGPILLASGISDPYPPIEKQIELTRNCLKSMQGFDKVFITKSLLPLRDLDLLANKNTILMPTIVFTDDKLSKQFEPRVEPVSKRFEMIKTFKQAGAWAGISAMPFLPLLGDDEKSIHLFCEKANDANADFALPGMLTLKAGIQKQTFLDFVKKHYPSKHSTICSIYSENKWHGGGSEKYYQIVWPRITNALFMHKIPMRVPHKIFKGKFQLYDEIYLLLSDMQKLYYTKGIDTTRLYKAKKNYRNWLDEEKKYISRRRKLSYNIIDEQIKERFLANRFDEIIKNPKLTGLLKDVIAKNVCFDYIKLKPESL